MSRSALTRVIRPASAAAATASRSQHGVAAAAASASMPSSTPRQRIERRILCFGDSLTEGYAQRGRTMHPYARALQREFQKDEAEEVTIEEAGSSGELTEEMLPRLKSILAAAEKDQRPYSLVLLLGGTNDICHEFGISGIISRLKQLHEVCFQHSATCRTVALTVPEIDVPKPGSMEAMMGVRVIDRMILQVNEAIRSFTAASNGRASLFDLHTLLPQHTPDPSSPSTAGLWDFDMVHFSIEGYEWIGARLAEFIMKEKLLEDSSKSVAAVVASDPSTISPAASTSSSVAASSTSSEPSLASQHALLDEAMKAITSGNLLEQTSHSFHDMHWRGLDSIWLSPTLRVFVTDADVSGMCQHDPLRPHVSNEGFLLHNHRYDLTSLPLAGRQENVLYEEVDAPPAAAPGASPDPMIAEYEKSLFYSAVFEESKKPRCESLGRTHLARISHTFQSPWFMRRDEIHRVVWRGPICALLREHRSPEFIDRSPTISFLIRGAKMPCEDGLYRAMSEEHCQRRLQEIAKHIEAYRATLPPIEAQSVANHH